MLRWLTLISPWLNLRGVLDVLFLLPDSMCNERLVFIGVSYKKWMRGIEEVGGRNLRCCHVVEFGFEPCTSEIISLHLIVMLFKI
jgi:hypothetical protein